MPYPSSPQAITALIRNDVQIACLPAIAVTPLRRNGRGEDSRRLYRATLSLFAKRATLKESGIDVEADAWDGLIAPDRCCARNWQPN